MTEPRRETDAAGDAVQFSDARAGFIENDVRADDAREFGLERRRALDFEEFCRLALVKQGGDPRGLFAGETLPVKKIDGAVELKKDASETFQLFGQFLPESERGRGDAPFLPREKSARRNGIADVPGGIGGVQGLCHDLRRHFRFTF